MPKKVVQEPVVVRNLDELEKGIPRKGKLLIHLTEDQWTQISKGLKFGEELPKGAVVFRFTPLPDGAGGIGSMDCVPSNPCENCIPRFGPARGGGQMEISCRCTIDPRCDIPLPPPTGQCKLVFSRQGLRWQLKCASVNCSRKCGMVGVRQGTSILITCACR